jgi:multicomponent Na+:H+ antiporter subunit C
MMGVLPYVVAVLVLLIGLAGVALSRDIIHLVVALTVAQSSTYVLLLAVGYRSGGTAPIATGAPPNARFVDPVVQALTLTDVVVSVVVAAVLLAIAVQVQRREGTHDPDRLRTMRG